MNKKRSYPAQVSFAASLALLAACTAPESERIEDVAPANPGSASATATYEVAEPELRYPATRVHDPAAAGRLLSAKGVTLQWIGWERRGSVNARMEGETLFLTAVQSAADGPGQLYLDGYVSEIGSDYFLFEGTIRISDAPDAGRSCEANKSWRFAVTQARPYWRLREFEWCDGLTDYVDIYF